MDFYVNKMKQFKTIKVTNTKSRSTLYPAKLKVLMFKSDQLKSASTKFDETFPDMEIIEVRVFLLSVRIYTSRFID